MKYFRFYIIFLIFIRLIFPFQILALGIHLPLGIPNLTIERFIILVSLLMILSFSKYRNFRFSGLQSKKILFTFLTYLFVCSIFSGTPSYFLLDYFNTWLVSIIILFLIYYGFNSQDQLNLLIKSLYIISIILVVFGLIEYASKVNIFYRIPNFSGIEFSTVYHGAESALQGQLMREKIFFRITGPYFDWSTYGTILALFLPLSIYYYKNNHRKINLFWIILFVIAIILTFTRSAILSASIGIIIFMYLSTEKKLKLIILPSILILTFNIFSEFFLKTTFAQERLMDVGTIEIRYQIWEMTLSIFESIESFIFGNLLINPGVSSSLLFGKLYGTDYVYSGSHQFYLSFIFKYGMISFVLYLLIIMNILKIFYKNIQTSRRKNIDFQHNILIFCFTSIIIYHIAILFFYNVKLNFVLWIIIAVGLKQISLIKQNYYNKFQIFK